MAQQEKDYAKEKQREAIVKENILTVILQMEQGERKLEEGEAIIVDYPNNLLAMKKSEGDREEENTYDLILTGTNISLGKINATNKTIQYDKEVIRAVVLDRMMHPEKWENGMDEQFMEDTEFLEYLSLERDKDKQNTAESLEPEQNEEDGMDDKEQAENDKPDLEEQDEIKDEIAKKYNVNVNQIVHISNNKKVTREHKFEGLAAFAKDYDDIYILQGDDPYTWKTIGIKDGKQQEIENQTFRQMAGRNPDVTIKRIDGEKITEIRPLAMYEIDNHTAIAIIKDKYGRPEALYCRQEGGKEKTYWGTIIPEASGKNVMQKDPKTREFMSYRTNSRYDLSKKADELEVATDMDKRGVPSDEKGVQTDDIDGTSQQNRQKRIDEIKDDLYKRLGINEKMKGAMPGYLDYIEKKLDSEANKIMELMESDDKIDYETAVKEVQAEDGEREEGGITPDQGSPLDRRG